MVARHGHGHAWMRELGGRRRPMSGSKHLALRNEAFRAYADYMETEPFRAGAQDLLGLATGASLAVMCSESVWWRCHRRLLADYFVLVHGADVVHLMHDDRLTLHVLTSGVRLAHNSLIYDVWTTPAFAVG